MAPVAEEGTLAVLVSLGLALFAALISVSLTCSEQHECLRRGTCFELTNSSFSCAFKTVVTPAGWRLLNASNQRDSLMAMSRGICAPGMRQSIDSTDGYTTCVRQRVYPAALNLEISDPDAATDHGRACGKWIDAGSVVLGSVGWAFFDEADVAADVEDVIAARGSGRLGSSDLAKFRSACRTMVTTSASGPAGTRAYQHLDETLRHVETLDAALTAVGLLSSYHCDTPAVVALSVDDTDSFTVRLFEGIERGGTVMRDALYAVGADAAVRDAAVAFAEAMAAIPSTDAASATSAQQRDRVALGSFEDSWLIAQLSTTLNVVSDDSQVPLGRMVKAFASEGSMAVRSYLRGLAAMCAFDVRAVITGEFGDVYSDLRASGLGRLPAKDGEARLQHMDVDDLHAASRVRWSALRAAAPLASATPSAANPAISPIDIFFPPSAISSRRGPHTRGTHTMKCSRRARGSASPWGTKWAQPTCAPQKHSCWTPCARGRGPPRSPWTRSSCPRRRSRCCRSWCRWCWSCGRWRSST